MPTIFEDAALVNGSQLPGTQDGARVLGLPNGGYVVAWTNRGATQAQTVWLQVFDSLGQPVGDQQQVFTGVGQITLRDLEMTSDGSFWIAATDSTSVLLKSFSALTLGPTTAQVSIAVPNAPTGVQIDQASAGPSGTLAVLISSDPGGGVSNFHSATVTSAGVASGLTLTNTSSAPAAIIEFESGGMTIASSGSNHVAFIGSGTPLVLPAGGRPTDLLRLADDLYVVALQNQTSMIVTLQAIEVSPSGALTLGGFAFAASGGSGNFTAGQNIYDVELVRLDQNRTMIVWVGDGGDTFPNSGSAVPDGVYASVFDLRGGSSPAVLVRHYGTTLNEVTLQGIELSAALLADGRVAVTMNGPGSGLTGTDVFHAILEDREGGVEVAASAGADLYVGTAQADIFTGVGPNDTIIGNGGEDLVVFSGAAAKVVDLANPTAFPETTCVLQGIRHLTGGTGNDAFYGDGLRNNLSGNTGQDTLFGRTGNDSLSGDNGNDLLFGGAGLDSLSGGFNEDSLFGGADADQMLGGAGNDVLRAGDGADALFGGEGNDRLYGDAGADHVEGGGGNDLISGGADADHMSGGLGNDTLRAADAGDSVFGAEGNDVLIAHAAVDVADGGVGTDTLILVRSAVPLPTVGMFADLTGANFSFGPARDYEVFEGVISDVENLTGTTGDDELVGSAVANVLRGGGGNDVLVGQGGSDVLIGGAGADMFVFLAAAAENDLVNGFEVGSDKLALQASAFGDLATVALSTRLTINAGATVAANTSAQLLFDNSGAGAGRLFFDADGNGAGVALLLATLSFSPAGGLAAFSATDFVFI